MVMKKPRTNNTKTTDMETKEKFVMKKQWVSTDAWRGGYFPFYYVAGANDTGTWDDSPCRSEVATSELKQVREHLKRNGVSSRAMVCQSSNIFMVRRFIVVKPSDFDRAKSLVQQFMENNPTSLLYGND